MTTLTPLVINLLSTIPIWAVMFYFFNRMVKSRDLTEKEIKKSINRIEQNINDLHTQLLLLEKDFSYAKAITSTIESLVNRVDKQSEDINEAFKRQRNGHI